jgi:hypothetical protein
MATFKLPRALCDICLCVSRGECQCPPLCICSINSSLWCDCIATHTWRVRERHVAEQSGAIRPQGLKSRFIYASQSAAASIHTLCLHGAAAQQNPGSNSPHFLPAAEPRLILHALALDAAEVCFGPRVGVRSDVATHGAQFSRGKI